MKLLFLSLMLVLWFPTGAALNVDSILCELDKELAKRPERFANKEQRIEMLKNLSSSLETPKDVFNRYYRICNEYHVYQADSTMAYAFKMIDIAPELNDPDAMTLAVYHIAHSYLAEGFLRRLSKSAKSSTPRAWAHGPCHCSPTCYVSCMSN